MSHLVFYFVFLLYAHLASYQVRSFKSMDNGAVSIGILSWWAQACAGGNLNPLSQLNIFSFTIYSQLLESIFHSAELNMCYFLSLWHWQIHLDKMCFKVTPQFLFFFFVQLLAIIKIFCILAYPCNGKTLP